MTPGSSRPVRLGLGANAGQFALLVVVNAFVGAMVGQERVLLPLLAERDFALASKTAMLSFIASFGLIKAIANLVTGYSSDRFGRRRLLLIGWAFGLPVPFLLIAAPSWSWVVAANLLLGVNQGLCWSATVIMKVDLVGPQRRGFAMGLNEFAGYGAVSLAALGTGYLAGGSGALRPGPLYPGVVIAILGALLSLLFVRETGDHARHESASRTGEAVSTPSFRAIFARSSWRDRTLFAVSQAGLVNNLNDGVVWGMLPVLLAAGGFRVRQIAVVAAVYPGVWCVAQLVTGALSDRWGRKWMIVAGMMLQGIAIAGFAGTWPFGTYVAAAALLGFGTALVYPALLAAVSDRAPPSWRASALGVYRFWRDSGYVMGALGAGLIADALGLHAAIIAVAMLTVGSGIATAALMRETAPGRRSVSNPLPLHAVQP